MGRTSSALQPDGYLPTFDRLPSRQAQLGSTVRPGSRRTAGSGTQRQKLDTSRTGRCGRKRVAPSLWWRSETARARSRASPNVVEDVGKQRSPDGNDRKGDQGFVRNFHRNGDERASEVSQIGSVQLAVRREIYRRIRLTRSRKCGRRFLDSICQTALRRDHGARSSANIRAVNVAVKAARRRQHHPRRYLFRVADVKMRSSAFEWTLVEADPASAMPLDFRHQSTAHHLRFQLVSADELSASPGCATHIHVATASVRIGALRRQSLLRHAAEFDTSSVTTRVLPGRGLTCRSGTGRVFSTSVAVGRLDISGADRQDTVLRSCAVEAQIRQSRRLSPITSSPQSPSPRRCR